MIQCFICLKKGVCIFMKKTTLLKKLIAGAMACIMVIPAYMIDSNAQETSEDQPVTISGLANVSAKNEGEYWDYRDWLRLKNEKADNRTTNIPHISDISETMDYCNPLVSKNFFCIDLNGKEYPAKTTDYKECPTLSQVDTLTASYGKYLKKNPNIVFSDGATLCAVGEGLRLANGYEGMNTPYNVWTYNGYAPEQNSKHKEAIEKWNKARQILKDFCKKNKNVVYGFAFVVPNVNYSVEDINNNNHMSWRDMQGTYVLMYRAVNEGAFKRCKDTSPDYPAFALSDIENDYDDLDYYNFKTLPNDYSSISITVENLAKKPENSAVFRGFGKDWQDGVHYLAKGSTKQLSLLQYESQLYGASHCVTKYDGAIEWTSSNTKVATVSDGLVTAKKAGVATITAKCNGNIYKYRLSVFTKGKKTTKTTYTSTNCKKIVVRLKDMSGVESVRWNNPYSTNDEYMDSMCRPVMPKFTHAWRLDLDCSTKDGLGETNYIYGTTDTYEKKLSIIIGKGYYKNYAKKLKKGIEFKMNALVTYKDGSTEKIYYNLVFKK